MSRQPDRTQICLLIIDMINEFTFDGAEKLFPAIEQTAATIATLKQRAKSVGLPVLYVNDNFGKWRSDFRTLVNRCVEDGCRGKRIAEALRPDKDDYFILKPKHSGFFATPLELLLRHLNIRRVVLTGVAGDNCVLFTAAEPICATSMWSCRQTAPYPSTLMPTAPRWSTCVTPLRPIRLHPK